MRRQMLAMTLGAAMLGSGCTPVTMELSYPNGYTGYLLDKHTLDVSQSKDFQLLRATAIMAMASRMATATVRDGRDGDAVAVYLAAASDEVNYAAADIYGTDGHPSCAVGSDAHNGACIGYKQNFESDLPMLEGRVINLLIAALPQERSRQFLADVRKGDVFGAAFAALRVGFQAVVGLDRSAGVYRTSLELAATETNCLQDSFDPQHGTTFAALKCLGLPPYRVENPPHGLGIKSSTPADEEYPLKALMAVAQSSCARLPLATDTPLADEAAQRNEMCQRVAFAPKPRPVSIIYTAGSSLKPPPGGAAKTTTPQRVPGH